MIISDEKKLKDRIGKLLEDVMTNETALLTESGASEDEYKLLSYSKTELGGDSIHVVTNLPEDLSELNKALINSTVNNRKAVWNFLTKTFM